MPWYLTEYHGGNGTKYGTCLWAENDERASFVAKQRRMGEKVLATWGGRDYHLLSESILSRKRNIKSKEFWHDAMFFAFVALSSKAATNEELFRDYDGLLHLLAHRQAFAGSESDALEPKFRVLANKARKIELRVPGWLSDSDRSRILKRIETYE